MPITKGEISKESLQNVETRAQSWWPACHAIGKGLEFSDRLTGACVSYIAQGIIPTYCQTKHTS